MRTYVYVDAENHYLRSLAVVRALLGSDIEGAKTLATTSDQSIYEPAMFPRISYKSRIIWDPDLQLFWDRTIVHALTNLMANSVSVDRAVYVTSCTGDENKAHEMRVAIRGLKFDPIVIIEPKNLQAQRGNLRDKDQLLDKAKGCDIALVTRMVADAAADLYDCCCLFTSDADYLPAVEAVRRLGKNVYVAGYERCLPQRSPYLYLPDRFLDLEKYLLDIIRGIGGPLLEMHDKANPKQDQ